MKQYFIKLVVTAFLLNIMWENLHDGLYTNVIPWMKNMGYFLCSLGDAVLVVIIYVVVAQIANDIKWGQKPSANHLLWVLLIGTIVALIAEKTALLLNWWQYNEQMPVLSLLGVGVSPWLQITLTPVISVLISSRLKQPTLVNNAQR